MCLQRRGTREQLLDGVTIEGNDFLHRGLSAGQCASLVEGDGAQTRWDLQRRATFDEDTRTRRGSEPGHHTHRSRQDQSTGTGDHQEH